MDHARSELKGECNYILEAQKLETYASFLNHHPDYTIPKYYPELSSDTILTTSYLPGSFILNYVDAD